MTMCKQCHNDGGPGPCINANCFLGCMQLGGVCHTIYAGGDRTRGASVAKASSPVGVLKTVADAETDMPQLKGVRWGHEGFVMVTSDVLLSAFGIEAGDTLLSIDGKKATGKRMRRMYAEGEHTLQWFSAKNQDYRSATFEI